MSDERMLCCDYHFGPSAAFRQAELPLIAVQHTAQIWSLRPSDLCCIQKQSMLIKPWDAAGLMRLLRFQSSSSPLQGVDPPPPHSLLSSDSTHPFTFIIRVSTGTVYGFSDSFAQSRGCWESDLCVIKAPTSPELPDNEVLLFSCLCCVGCEQRHQTRSLNFRRTVSFDGSLSSTTVTQIPKISFHIQKKKKKQCCSKDSDSNRALKHL